MLFVRTSLSHLLDVVSFVTSLKIMIKAYLKASHAGCVVSIFSEFLFSPPPRLLLSLFYVRDFSELVGKYLLSFDICHVRSEQESWWKFWVTEGLVKLTAGLSHTDLVIGPPSPVSVSTSPRDSPGLPPGV